VRQSDSEIRNPHSSSLRAKRSNPERLPSLDCFVATLLAMTVELFQYREFLVQDTRLGLQRLIENSLGDIEAGEIRGSLSRLRSLSRPVAEGGAFMKTLYNRQRRHSGYRPSVEFGANLPLRAASERPQAYADRNRCPDFCVLRQGRSGGVVSHRLLKEANV
jgi:hypothetical protein